jgi:uncharacterized protein (DUF58 family)
VLTPTGAGVLSLFIPGLIIAGVSGQRLFGVISVGAGLLLGVNAILARRQLSRLSLRAWGPASADVGQPFGVGLALEGRPDLECAVGIEHAERAWIPAEVPARGDLVLRLDERGVLDRLRVRLQTSAPFGLTACIQLVEVELDPPVSVAPRSLAAAIPLSLAGPEHGYHPETGEVSGLRPYQAGDRPRDVHWPAFARTGSLLVRNHDGHDEVEVEVVVDTHGAASGVDEVLGRARYGVERILAAGYRVRLVTVEDGPPEGVVADWVASPVEVAARLARVTHAPAGPGPVIGSTARCLVATAEGLAWRPSS